MNRIVRVIAPLLAICWLLMMSCAQQITPGHSQPDLAGTWNWVQSQGGFAGRTETKETSGRSITLQINPDQTYRITQNDTVQSEGRYRLIRVKSIYNHDSTAAIHYSDPSLHDLLIQQLSSDSLVLADNVYDGFSYVYVR